MRVTPLTKFADSRGWSLNDIYEVVRKNIVADIPESHEGTGIKTKMIIFV